MKAFTKALAVAALVIGTLGVASATPITGAGSVAGADTYTYNAGTNFGSITFAPSVGFFFNGSGSMAQFDGTLAKLTSFDSSTAAGTTVFSAYRGANELSFTISQLLSTGYDADTKTLSFAGLGYFNETGFDQTNGSFSLSTSTTSAGRATITSFQLNGAATTAVTPEPSSLVLLGTGLIGTASTLLRRRRISA